MIRFGRPVRWWAVFGAIALVGNATWEVAQRSLYDDPGSVAHCLRAAVSDLGWTLAAAVLAVVATRRLGARAFTPALVVSLFAIAAAIEAWALATDRWSYAAAMPTVAGVGLAPLFQLPLIGWVASRTASAAADELATMWCSSPRE